MEHLEFLDSRQLPIPELIEDLEEENARVKKLHLTEMEGRVYKVFGIVTNITLGGAQSGEGPAFAGRGEEFPSKDGAIFVLHEHRAYCAPCALYCAAGEDGNCGGLVSREHIGTWRNWLYRWNEREKVWPRAGCGCEPTLMGLLREQENTPFLTAEEGRMGRFSQNFPAGFLGLSFNLSCLWFWAVAFGLTI